MSWRTPVATHVGTLVLYRPSCLVQGVEGGHEISPNRCEENQRPATALGTPLLTQGACLVPGSSTLPPTVLRLQVASWPWSARTRSNWTNMLLYSPWVLTASPTLPTTTGGLPPPMTQGGCPYPRSVSDIPSKKQCGSQHIPPSARRGWLSRGTLPWCLRNREATAKQLADPGQK